jgi:hypothetical protein
VRVRLPVLSLAAALLLAAAAQAQTFRDPMRPAGATQAAAPAIKRPQAAAPLKLEGIITGPTRVAIVNGRLVRAGDVVAGVTVLEVLPDAVRYSRAGRIQTLALPGARPIPGVRVARSAEATTP